MDEIKSYLQNIYAKTKWPYFRVADVKNAVNIDNFNEAIEGLKNQNVILFRPGIHGVLVELIINQ